MAKITNVDKIFTEAEKEILNKYDNDMASLLKQCQGKIIGGVHWSAKMVKDAHYTVTAYNIYQKAADKLEDEKIAMTKKLNNKIKQYEKATTNNAAQKYLKEYKEMLQELNQVKEDYNYYETERVKLLNKALEYDKKIMDAKAFLKKQEKAKDPKKK